MSTPTFDAPASALAGDPLSAARLGSRMPSSVLAPLQAMPEEWTGDAHDPSLAREELLHQFFEATAALRPGAAAVCWALSDSPAMTYEQLDGAANRLAAVLRARGVGRGDRVAIFLPRSVQVYVALLAILKAGAAYVPLDPDYPAQRVESILADCNVQVLVSTSALVESLPALRHPVLRLDTLDAELARAGPLPPASPAATPDDIAYIIYTSGSAGKPKGVPITHRAVCNLVRAEARIFSVRPGDRVYQGFSVAFDASVEEIWLAFFSGATLVAASAEMARAGPDLAQMLRQARVSVLSCVPTLLSMMHDDIPGLRLLILGGELCTGDLVKRWSRPGRRIVNTYGPTEATVIATFGECAAGRPVTIGRPVPNYRVYILDENARPAPTGEPGELCIAGPGLSPGYLNRPQLTGEKFQRNPFSSAPFYNRIYRTGDLARFTESGEIEFLGRIDAQVKLRGFRIELGEIEAAIRECCAEAGGRPLEVAVTLREDIPGMPQLVAYFVNRGERPWDTQGVVALLRRRLPGFMIPSCFEPIAQIPTLVSGKIDRKSLPAPQRGPSVAAAGPADPPQGDMEQRIAGVWGRLTGQPEISRSADFFSDLGGHSLTVARAVSELRTGAGLRDLSVLDMYNHPTLEKLAAALEARARRRQREEQIPARQPESAVRARRGVYPIFCIAQFLGLYFVVGFYSLQWITPYLTYVWAVAHEQTRMMAVFWALAVLLVLHPAMLLITIAVKWILVGRMKEGSYPLWGFFHLRWWLMNRLLDCAAVEYLEGTPLLGVYYRLMGTRVGRRAHVGSCNIGAFDLVSVGDDVHLGDASAICAYTIENGMLTFGPVRVGNRCHLGAGSVLRPNTIMEDDSRILHASMLSAGQTIPQGETWFGSPARSLENQQLIPRPAPPPAPSRKRRIAFASFYAMGIFVLPVVYLAALFPGLMLFTFLGVNYGELPSLLAAPAVAVMFIGLLGLEIIVVKWLVLGRVKPGEYPIHGTFYLRKWFVDQLMGLSLDILGPLYGTLYLNPWYKALGAKMGRRAEISTACSASPDLLEIGDESFIADAVLLGVPQIDAGMVSLRHTRIGRRAFIGNSALLPAGSIVGDKSLIGVLSTPPLSSPGAAENDTTWLGSPAIFLPQRQASSAFNEETTFKPRPSLVALRLFIEFFRITLPITIFVVLTSLLITTVIEISPYLSVLERFLVFPALYFTAGSIAALLVIAAKWLLIGRYKDCEKPLWSTFVWRSELINALHEHLAGAFFTDMLVGTPLLCWFFRLLGMKIGKRVHLDTAEFTEFDLVTIGDDAMLNLDSTIQTHLFEDRVMKMSTVDIGRGAAVGAGSVVLYSSTIHAGAVLEDLSLVMKGESLPENTRWHGTPARKTDEP